MLFSRKTGKLIGTEEGPFGDMYGKREGVLRGVTKSLGTRGASLFECIERYESVMKNKRR